MLRAFNPHASHRPNTRSLIYISLGFLYCTFIVLLRCVHATCGKCLCVRVSEDFECVIHTTDPHRDGIHSYGTRWWWGYVKIRIQHQTNNISHSHCMFLYWKVLLYGVLVHSVCVNVSSSSSILCIRVVRISFAIYRYNSEICNSVLCICAGKNINIHTEIKHKLSAFYCVYSSTFTSNANASLRQITEN